MRKTKAPSKYINTNQVADLLLCEKQTIELMRRNGTGPAFYRVGRKILYLITEVEEFVQSCRVEGAA